MPIPQVKTQTFSGGAVAVNRRAVRLEDGLEDAREGVLAMLGLGAENPSNAGAVIWFRQDASLLPGQYRIDADQTEVSVEAGDCAGAVYAAATIAQLCAEYGGAMPCGETEDAPASAWRGFLIDVCRHFFPLQTLKTLVDLMAYYKYNRLHLHLSEDQGFRFESERFPLLNSVGSYRNSTFVKRGGVAGQDGIPYGGYYTKAELRELVRYARARGIEIVSEIDMPGHALAMIAAYPDLACVSEPVEVATRFGVTDFSKKLLCAGREETYAFLFALLDEVMDVFPFDHVHIGGDEALKDEWKRCARCQGVMRENGIKNEHALQGYFLNRVIAYLASRGKTAIVWNDGACDSLDPRAVVQYWTPLTRRGPGQIARHVNAGGKAILSPVTRLYFDYPYAATPLIRTYGFSPTLRGIRKDRADGILGQEAALWTEWIDTDEKLFFNTLPRLAAAAETGWSGRRKPRYDRFLLKLKPHYDLYGRLGLTYAKNAEKPLSLLRRIRKTATFVQNETHAELIAQQQEKQ